MPLDMQSAEKSTYVETHVLGAETGTNYRRQISWQDETSPSRIDSMCRMCGFPVSPPSAHGNAKSDGREYILMKSYSEKETVEVYSTLQCLHPLVLEDQRMPY